MAWVQRDNPEIDPFFKKLLEADAATSTSDLTLPPTKVTGLTKKKPVAADDDDDDDDDNDAQMEFSKRTYSRGPQGGY